MSVYPLSQLGFQFVASGINLFYSFDNLIIGIEVVLAAVKEDVNALKFASKEI